MYGAVVFGQADQQHLRKQQKAATARDAGYYKTTPFFISFMENPKVLRKAGCDWQTAMAHFATGNKQLAAAFAASSLKGEPANLYAGLIAQGK